MRIDARHPSRRQFLSAGAVLAASAPHWPAWGQSPTPGRRNRVAILPCLDYDAATLKAVYQKSFDLLGGIRKLVGGKTVTIKLNLTGTNFTAFFRRPPGESYMTHYATVATLLAVLFEQGAKRVRLVESTNSRAELPKTLALGDWDIAALTALGPVEFENTRNLGSGKAYATLKVPGGGGMFSSFDLNHSYADTDVFISMVKLKDHVAAGVTLTMKNLFGITPNALYGDEAGSENAVAGRGRLHGPGFLHVPRDAGKISLPGLKKGYTEFPADGGYRVPHTVTDLCAARPVDLAIIDGITTMTGGEGPWCPRVGFTKPGVMIVGLNPVATDAVGTAVMGYTDPRAPRGQPPFDHGLNHLLLAEQASLGTADLKQIEIVGQALEKSVHPFPKSPLKKTG